MIKAQTQTKAKEYRLKALNVAQTMLNEPVYDGQEKENLFIIAAMYHLTNNNDSSLVYLEKASLLTYENSKMEEKEAKDLDIYLTDLIIQYIAILKSNSENFFK